MRPKLFAFDLDGTLLTTGKRLSERNRDALIDMSRRGAVIALASGRLRSSMVQYAHSLGINPAMLTLNGAAVFSDHTENSKIIYHAPLASTYADSLIAYAAGKDFAINYYIDNELHSSRSEVNARWIDLYHQQTGTKYHFLEDMSVLAGRSPSKVIFVGEPRRLDSIEDQFRRRWKNDIYIVRTWEYYLEFLCRDANKARGLHALARSLHIDLKDVVAFGDAENDIPMLREVGLGIAVHNASDIVKKSAHYVSPWTNDEDAVAREWERMKKKYD